MFFFRKHAIYEIESIDFSVRRRMDEFEKLWRLLEVTYPAQLVPPLEADNLGLALQAICDHPIFKDDEYLRVFLTEKEFANRIQMIKNVEGPISLRKEYFERGNIVKRILITSGMSRDSQYQRVIKRVEGLSVLKDTLKQLVPLFDRLDYERREVIKAAEASDQSIRTLLYMNKSERLYSEDQNRTSEYLKAIHLTGESGDITGTLNFCVKYLESIERLVSKLNKFRAYLSGRREIVAEVSKKLEGIQCVGDARSKPSFDLIYKTKLRHEQVIVGTLFLLLISTYIFVVVGGDGGG